MLQSCLSRSGNFFIFFAGYIVMGAYFLAFLPKGDEIYILSYIHNPFFDFFFKNFTHLGDGIFCIVVAIILFLFRFYNGILVLMSFTISGLISTALKRLVFDDFLRPSAILDKTQLHFVEGVALHTNYSFPSGHTTSAFALFFSLALIMEKRSYAFLFFCGAFLVGLSRMYLVQHFFMDTYAGAILGVLISFLSALFLENFPKLKEKNFINLPKLGF